MTTFSNTMSVASILSADFTTCTVANMATMFVAASTRETSAAYAKEFVVWSAVNVRKVKPADLTAVFNVGKSQISNYVKHVDMVREMNLVGETFIVQAWTALTGSRGWFPKRSTDEYKDLVKAVNATDDQASKVALITGTPLPENEEKTPTIADAIRMLEAARDLLRTLDVSPTDQTIVSTLTGEIDAAAVAAVPVAV